jgi:anti-sigma factor (TIGR02949 family)
MKLNCQEAIGQLSDYLDRNLPQEMREAIVEHMDRCPACVTFTETYEKTKVLCRKALRKKAPEGLAERVLAFVRDHAEP